MPIVRKGSRHSLDSHMNVNPNNQYSISSFLNNEYKEYSLYVLETRSSPRLDGFKEGARKILYSAFTGDLKQGQHKIMTLVGDVYKKTEYLHGDASLIGTVHTLSADFMNNTPCLEVIGANGSLRAPNAMAQPRYLSAKLSKYAFIYEYDSDLWKYCIVEGKQAEPEILYPPICTILTTQAIGLAPGFAFKSFSYNPVDVIDAQIEYIKNEKIKTQLRPYVKGMPAESFTYSEKSRRWTSSGKYSLNEKTHMVQITDFPYDVTFKQISETYNKLLDQKKIVDWKDYSHNGSVDYRVMLSPGDFNRLSASRSDLEKMLLLSSVVPQNILNVINEKNKLQNFQDEYALLEHFTKWRLTIYAERKTRLINVMEEKFRRNNDICQFIALVNSGKIKIQNRKKSDIKEDLKKHNLSDEVLNIEISKLTDEEKEVLLKKNEDIKKELEYIRQTDIKDMFINDLKDIRKKIKDDFV